MNGAITLLCSITFMNNNCERTGKSSLDAARNSMMPTTMITPPAEDENPMNADTMRTLLDPPDNTNGDIKQRDDNNIVIDDFVEESPELEPVFILAGQSNMAGRCEERDLPANFHLPTDFAVQFCWNNDSNFGEPFSIGEWGHLRCQPSPGLNKVFFGPEFGLAETLGGRFVELQERSTSQQQQTITSSTSTITSAKPTAVPPPKRMHFIKFAMGSTNLHSNWNPANTPTASTEEDGQELNPQKQAHYHEFIKYCRESLKELRTQTILLDNEGKFSSSVGDEKNNKNEEGSCSPSSSTSSTPKRRQRRLMKPYLAGMFWLQGESDSSKARDAKKYLSNFQSFVAAVRNDLGVPNMPVVASPVVWKNGKYVHLVNEALREAGQGAVSNCVCIDELDTNAYGVQPAEAGACRDHLTGDAVHDIGRRMGRAFPLS